MAESATATRRALLSGIAAAPMLAAAAEPPLALERVTEWEVVPLPPWDGALHTREPRIRELEARAQALSDAEDRIAEACEAELGPRPPEGTPAFLAWRERWAGVYAAHGHDAAREAWEVADRALRAAIIPLDDIPARTYAGLRMKARYVRHYQELAFSIVEDLLAMDAAIRAQGGRAYDVG